MDVAQYELAPRIEDPTVRKVRLESYVTFAGPGGFATPDDVEALESCQQGAEAGIVAANGGAGRFKRRGEKVTSGSQTAPAAQ